LASRGWKPFPFQREVWRLMAGGTSGLLHAPTGTGKTLAAWLGALGRARSLGSIAGLRVVWLTPLKALAADTVRALEEPLPALSQNWLPGPWDVAVRTGDTSAADRRRLRGRPPAALVTTPETLSIMLSLDDAHEVFAGLETIIVDEWHELLSTKRGVQAELALARLRTLAPNVITWGLSATLANLDEAVAALVGPSRAASAKLVQARVPRRLAIETLIPKPMERFPWAGHMGMRLLPQVIERIETATTSLVFTNTRSQAERWFEAIGTARPDWKPVIALHHGSVDREQRAAAEDGLRRGRISRGSRLSLAAKHSADSETRFDVLGAKRELRPEAPGPHEQRSLARRPATPEEPVVVGLAVPKVWIAEEVTADLGDEPHHLGHLEARGPVGIAEHSDMLERIETVHLQMASDEIGIGHVVVVEEEQQRCGGGVDADVLGD
jgi:Lhr-like helicase